MLIFVKLVFLSVLAIIFAENRIKMATFTIDFFELMFLAEATIPPRPIARAVFFENLSDAHYHKMTLNQREQMFNYITKNASFDLENEDCRHFFARFNPKNQYLVKCFHKGEASEIEAYRFNEEFHTAKNRRVSPEYIKSYKKKTE